MSFVLLSNPLGDYLTLMELYMFFYEQPVPLCMRVYCDWLLKDTDNQRIRDSRGQEVVL